MFLLCSDYSQSVIMYCLLMSSMFQKSTCKENTHSIKENQIRLCVFICRCIFHRIAIQVGNSVLCIDDVCLSVNICYNIKQTVSVINFQINEVVFSDLCCHTIFSDFLLQINKFSIQKYSV